ncbi:MAG: TonB-dependent receptor [Chthoniobacterales bacterium]
MIAAMVTPRLFSIILLSVLTLALSAARAQDTDGRAEVLSVENVVDVASGSGAWSRAAEGQNLAIRDRLRTGEESRAAVRLADASILRVDELTETEILPPRETAGKPTLNLKQGAAYFFSREETREVQVETPAANGAIRGTEFVVRVAPGGKTSFVMLDGELELSNPQGSVRVRGGEAAEVEPGGVPRKTAVLNAINVIQWCLYYPGVLDLKEMGFSARERDAWGGSLGAYEQGDLLAALRSFSGRRSGLSDSGKVYRASLLLAVGQVDKARPLLRAAAANTPGRDALFTLIAAVTLGDREDTALPQTASGWVAESYYRQSKADLPAALEAAQKATEIDPSFGFAWTRIAELQFSFGRVPQALEALERGLQLSPRNPAAHALRGFLLAAENRIKDAQTSFEEAMAIDSALGNAWLGRGLCYIRRGEAVQGRRDLQTAAALEPNRSIFHSYLGKAFSNLGNARKTYQELDRAKELDPNDPTPWLYSAIENKQNNRINRGIRDLERSIELNDNRRVFRSRFLLDQDKAVRGANLAAIYQAAGMDELSVREATRAVDANYSNASAHLFLANSYNALRDPKRINLRFETPWFNELLLANLLSPVGGGPLSQFVSEQEYSKLFESDGFGFSSSTSYISGTEVQEMASQYGTFGNFSYSIDTDYFYDNGKRPNNEIKRSETYGQMKFQITPRDVLFLQTKYQDVRQDDLLQRYNQDDFSPGVNFREVQQPAILLAGFRHEWAPGVQTLLLAGRLADEITFRDVNSAADSAEFVRTGTRPNVSRSLIFTRNRTGDITGAFLLPLDLRYHSEFTTYTGEINQIWETEQNTLIAGARFQSGEFQTSDRFDNPPPFTSRFFNNPAAAHNFETSLERQTVYAYDTWRPVRSLSLTGGLAFDRLHFPENHRNPPLIDSQSTRTRFSPKAGVIWNPFDKLFVRGAYTRALGGVSFDESVQLEPNQVAGFNQVFRSIISESVVGSVSAPFYETGSLLIENKFPTGTYVGLQGSLLRSDVKRRIGTFDASFVAGALVPPIVASSAAQQLDYKEQNVLFTLNQLLGDEWSFGLRYQFIHADLTTRFREVPAAILDTLAENQEQATLHQGQIFALYNHPSGLFARAEGYWARQSNEGYNPALPGEDLFQFNAYVGYRFRRNFGEITLGFLNLTDQDYQLNPLTLYNELPRERTILARMRINF